MWFLFFDIVIVVLVDDVRVVVVVLVVSNVIGGVLAVAVLDVSNVIVVVVQVVSNVVVGVLVVGVLVVGNVIVVDVVGAVVFCSFFCTTEKTLILFRKMIPISRLISFQINLEAEKQKKKCLWPSGQRQPKTLGVLSSLGLNPCLMYSSR